MQGVLRGVYETRVHARGLSRSYLSHGELDSEFSRLYRLILFRSSLRLSSKEKSNENRHLELNLVSKSSQKGYKEVNFSRTWVGKMSSVNFGHLAESNLLGWYPKVD